MSTSESFSNNQMIKEKIINEMKNESEKMYYKIYYNWRLYDQTTSILAFIGFILSIILYEYSINLNHENYNLEEYPNAIDHPKVNN